MSTSPKSNKDECSIIITSQWTEQCAVPLGCDGEDHCSGKGFIEQSVDYITYTISTNCAQYFSHIYFFRPAYSATPQGRFEVQWHPPLTSSQ